MAILGIVGEVAGRAETVSRAAEAMGLGQMLGWWNDVGQILITVGTIVGALAGTVELVSGASLARVEAVQADVGGVREAVSGVREEVGGVRRDVGNVHEAVEANGDQLGKLEGLDDIEHALNEQTSVLEQIRDR